MCFLGRHARTISGCFCPGPTAIKRPRKRLPGMIWRFRTGKSGGVIAQMPIGLSVLDETLKCGMIGSVSVHPYARGEGHMKRLMAMAAEDARERQYDLMILGGQRQRYNYFGFERAVYVIRHAVMQTNLRHCHGDAEMGSFAFSELTDDCPETNGSATAFWAGAVCCLISHALQLAAVAVLHQQCG